MRQEKHYEAELRTNLGCVSVFALNNEGEFEDTERNGFFKDNRFNFNSVEDIRNVIKEEKLNEILGSKTLIIKEVTDNYDIDDDDVEFFFVDSEAVVISEEEINA